MSNYPEGKFCPLDPPGRLRREVQLVDEMPEYDADGYATYLGATAVHVKRNQLKDLVSDKRARTVKGNLAPEYAEGANTRFWARVNDTRQKLPPLPRTHQSPCKPFESGSNVLPGLEAWCKRNGIHP